MNIPYKYACVVDIRDIYQDIVLVHIVHQPDGTTKDEIQFCTLNPGERLLDTAPPIRRPHAGAEGLVRPHWDGQAWEEAATAAEIKQWEQEHPAPTVEPSTPTTEERLAASEQQLTDMQIALAEAYEYSDTQNTNTQMALVEVYELLATSMEGGVSGG